MNDAYRMLRLLKRHPTRPFALATVVAVEGSSYRRAGAKMLIAEDGSRYGTISAGCLEDDLTQHATDVIRSRLAKTLIYDLRSEDDWSWGQGAGCNGRITVLVEPCEWERGPQPGVGEHVWARVEAMLREGRRVASAKRIGVGDAGLLRASGKAAGAERMGGEDAGAGPLFCAENGEAFGTVSRGAEETLVPELRRFLAGDASIRLVAVDGTGGEWLLEKYEPREPLYLFGAGPDAEPVARLASALDFDVTVVDPRDERCNERHFPTADRHVVRHAESYLQEETPPSASYVLVMTHSFQRDRHIVRKLLQAPVRYLGVLGSRSRTARLLAPDPPPEWLHAPVGLAIGAEGPEEIAVSIAAQLLKVRNNR